MKELTKEKAIELNGQRIEIEATRQIDFMEVKIKGRFTIFVDDRDGLVWFLKRRNSMRGFTLHGLKNLTYKLIKK